MKTGEKKWLAVGCLGVFLGGALFGIEFSMLIPPAKSFRASWISATVDALVALGAAVWVIWPLFEEARRKGSSR